MSREPGVVRVGRPAPNDERDERQAERERREQPLRERYVLGDERVASPLDRERRHEAERHDHGNRTTRRSMQGKRGGETEHVDGGDREAWSRERRHRERRLHGERGAAPAEQDGELTDQASSS